MAFDMGQLADEAAKDRMPKTAYYTDAEQAALAPSFILVPNIYNFRHLGVHKLSGGRRARTDLMFRSAEPSPIVAAGVEKLHTLGVTTVYDLRSTSEIERGQRLTPVVDIPGTTRQHVPLRFKESVMAQAASISERYSDDDPQHFVDMYDEYLHLGVDAYTTIFCHLRDRPQEPFLVHCMAGKDRTGVIAALVLDLLGVAHEDIADEYALTTQGIKPWLPLATAVLLREPRFQGYPDRVARLLSSEKGSMLAFLAHLRGHWGGARGYLTTTLGFSEHDVETIRANATEPDV